MGVSFRAVEGVGFRGFIQELPPRYKLANRKKVAAGVWDLFLAERAKLLSVISDLRASITTDTKASIQNINYMVIIVHLIDGDWKLHKRIIEFTTITGHKGKDTGKILEVCLNGWGIDKLFSITIDNVTFNDRIVEYMKKRFRALKTLLFDLKYMHMRCACHILKTLTL